MKQESNEMFYLDANGRKCDAELHADMLDDNSEADAAFERRLAASRERARDAASGRPSGLPLS